MDQYNSGFSEKIDNFFCEANIIPCCYFSSQVTEEIKKSVIESICMFFGKSNEWLPARQLNRLSQVSTMFLDNYDSYGRFKLWCQDDGEEMFVSWKTIDEKIVGESFISLYAYLKHCYEKEAVQELFDLYGRHLRGALKFGDDFLSGANQFLRDHLDYVSLETKLDLELGLPKEMLIGGHRYTECKHLPVEAPGNSFIGLVHVYCCPGKRDIALPSKLISEITLKGKFYDNLLVFGHPSYVYLSNVGLIEKNRHAKIILCEDFLVASCLDEIIRDSKRYAHCDYIATSWYGMFEYSKFADFSILRNRDVVFIPSLSRRGYKNVEFYNNKMKNIPVNSFRVLRSPVVRFPVEHLEFDTDALSDPFERYIANNYFDLQRCESHVLFEICEKSIGFESYASWCSDVGLDLGASSASSNDSGLSRVPNLDRVNSVSLGQERVYFSEFFSKNYLTGFIGSSDSGKSIVGYSLAVAMCFGLDMFMFEGGDKRSILYVDGENSEDYADGFIGDMVCSYDLNRQEIENFRHISLRSMDNDAHGDGSSKSNIDGIESPEAKKMIEVEILRHKISVVFFDNLMSLTRAAYETSRQWKDLEKWFRTLSQRFSVAVVFFHHTNKEMETKGVVDVESSSQNIVVLEGNSASSRIGNLTLDNTKNEKHKKSDFNVQWRFNKSKQYPFLKNKTYSYVLKSDESKGCSLKWVDISSGNNGQRSNADVKSYFTNIVKDRSLDEKCIDICIYANINAKFKRNEIDKLLSCQESTSQNLLKSLVGEQILNVCGKGKRTQYELRKEYRPA